MRPFACHSQLACKGRQSSRQRGVDVRTFGQTCKTHIGCNRHAGSGASSSFFWYVNDYYRADSTALAAVADENGSSDGVVVRKLPDGSLVFEPEHPQMGLVFYPGGKVQPEAYAPLLERCAKQGVLSVLVRPPFNLAILNENMADGVQEQFPQIATWVIAGHSLGGVAAANYLSQHESSFDGIALMASYPTCDLSNYGGNPEAAYRPADEHRGAKHPDVIAYPVLLHGGRRKPSAAQHAASFCPVCRCAFRDAYT